MGDGKSSTWLHNIALASELRETNTWLIPALSETLSVVSIQQVDGMA